MEDGSGISLPVHVARNVHLLLPLRLLLGSNVVGTTDLPIAVYCMAEVVAAEIFRQIFRQIFREYIEVSH